MTNKSHSYIPELWGGIECSFNRVGDRYFDQLEFSNHYQRGEKDIARIAELGVKKMRYPILWEYHQPYTNSEIDWSWTIQQLSALYQHNITPIVGLLHHGSGPLFTNLLDEQFSEKFAAYASMVAKKFPNLKYYTPINEPLTTARFSGLYGLWYPHEKSDNSFALMLINQLKATVLAMEAIRKINPEAQLVQTEDLGKTYCTPLLQYQADFENERRWLTFDFLAGRVDKNHSLWNYFIDAGVPEKDLYFFQEHRCPSDVLGINHYLTSERYLDERLNLYPSHTHGGNGVHAYADIEAIRIKHNQLHGIFWLLLEAWKRYGQQIALTEVHLHCTREEQLRWLKEKIDIASICADHDIPLIAVTAWSMLGAYGWNKLLTSLPFTYEAGVFDLSHEEPRPTVLASLLKHYAAGKTFHHPVLDQPAWWTRSDRYLLPTHQTPVSLNTNARPIFILSNEENKVWAHCIHHYCKQRGILSYVVAFDAEESAFKNLLRIYNPWALINCELLREEDALYKSQLGLQRFLNDTLSPFKLVGFVAPWLELPEAENAALENTLLVRCELMDNPLFTNFTAEIGEATEYIDVALQVALQSHSHLSDFINDTLNLLIDDSTGVWSTSKSVVASVQDLVQDSVFE